LPSTASNNYFRNIFRAFKRELKTIYNAHIGEGAMAEEKDLYKSKFISNVRSFTEAFVRDANIEISGYPNFNMDV